MHAGNVRDSGTLWALGSPPAGRGGSDDAGRVRGAVPGDGGSSLRQGGARVDGGVPPSGIAQRDTGAVPGGRQRASWTGRADGGAVRSLGGEDHSGRPRFDIDAPPGGYAWWYLDALSDDGAYGLTLIAFIGSVFSPYYAWARRRGDADPLAHCALNVALYGGRGARWAMTERGARSVCRGDQFLVIGPSALAWDGRGLAVEIDEMAAPVPRRIRGTVRLHPCAIETRAFSLDGIGRHRWQPIAPCGRVEVALDRPAIRWSGPAYFDTNRGACALEHDFVEWNWSRACLPSGTAVLYDVTRRAGEPIALALRYDSRGGVADVDMPPSVSLPRTLWHVPRRVGCDAGSAPRLDATWEDSPFYTRSLVSTRLFGLQVRAVHESLSLDRFRARWVQALLPFRMPRALGAFANGDG